MQQKSCYKVLCLRKDDKSIPDIQSILMSEKPSVEGLTPVINHLRQVVLSKKLWKAGHKFKIDTFSMYNPCLGGLHGQALLDQDAAFRNLDTGQ